MEAQELVGEILAELQAKVPVGQPVVMVNLLRFREQAVYPPDTGIAATTGRKAYDRYTELTLPHLRKVGARPIWRADARTCLFAPKGETWDEVILVRYPSLSAFERMISNPQYQAGAIHRAAALEDSRLIPTIAPQAIGRLAWWLISRLPGLARR